MTDTLRVTIQAPDADIAGEVKEAFFKQLYEQQGVKVVFELPAGADDQADEITAFAEERGCTASRETHGDDLADAAPVDFW